MLHNWLCYFSYPNAWGDQLTWFILWCRKLTQHFNNLSSLALHLFWNIKILLHKRVTMYLAYFVIERVWVRFWVRTFKMIWPFILKVWCIVDNFNSHVLVKKWLCLVILISWKSKLIIYCLKTLYNWTNRWRCPILD